jgi:hypothetical protein
MDDTLSYRSCEECLDFVPAAELRDRAGFVDLDHGEEGSPFWFCRHCIEHMRSDAEVVAKQDELFYKLWHDRYTMDCITGRTDYYAPEMLKQARSTATKVEARFGMESPRPLQRL